MQERADARRATRLATPTLLFHSYARHATRLATPTLLFRSYARHATQPC